jgi:hypothetical protein|eukprot:COSAG06_NODE_2072_length_7660_cov_2.682449_8_plen_103_part_00
MTGRIDIHLTEPGCASDIVHPVVHAFTFLLDLAQRRHLPAEAKLLGHRRHTADTRGREERSLLASLSDKLVSRRTTCGCKQVSLIPTSRRRRRGWAQVQTPR